MYQKKLCSLEVRQHYVIQVVLHNGVLIPTCKKVEIPHIFSILAPITESLSILELRTWNLARDGIRREHDYLRKFWNAGKIREAEDGHSILFSGMRVEPSTLKGFYSMKSRHVFLMSAGMLVCIVLCVFCGLSWAGCAQDRCCLLTPFHLLLQWLLYVPQTQDTEQRLRNGLLLYYYDTMLDQTKQGMVFVRPYHSWPNERACKIQLN